MYCKEGVSMDFFEMFSTVFIPILLIYTLIFTLMYAQSYLRMHARNRMLKFTQEEVKEKRREIIEIYRENEILKNTGRNPLYNIDKIIRIFSLYNEMAVGINEGLYDELYVKMVLGYDMMDFYKNNYKVIMSISDEEINSSRFMPLELLLKKWDSGLAPSYRINKRRGYF